MQVRTVAAVTASLALATGAGACSDEESKPLAEVPDIPAGTTYVKLDKGFVEALGSLKLTPGVIGSANLSGGSLRFPITEGTIKYFKPGTEDPYVQGELRHDGSGRSLKKGKTTVALTNFRIDPGKSELTGTVSANGKVVKRSTPLFFLDGRTLKKLREVKDGVVLQGTKVKLKGGAAELLNTTFETDALAAGFLIGTAKIVVRTEVS